MLERIQTTLAAIKTKMCADNKIKKLLLHDAPDALKIQDESVEFKDIGDYVTLRPVFEFENKEDYNQNSIVNIYMTQCDPSEDTQSIFGMIQINVVCNQDVWDLDDYKIRPIEISNRIIKLLNNAKFTVSNKLVFSTMTDLIINKKVFGYALLFEFTDGSGENNKF